MVNVLDVQDLRFFLSMGLSLSMFICISCARDVPTRVRMTARAGRELDWSRGDRTVQGRDSSIFISPATLFIFDHLGQH
jgi:hypothetical protein